MKFDHKEAFALGLFGSGSLLGDGVGNCKLVSVSEPFSWHCSWASSSWRIYSWLQSIHRYVVWKSRLRNDWKCCHHCAASRLRTHHLCITSTHWHWLRQLCAEPWVQARLKKSLQVHSLVEKQKAAPGGEDDGMKLGVGL